MIIMPHRTTREIDEANGLNKMIMPQIKSIIPSNSSKAQFEYSFLMVIAMLTTLMLDNIIHIPNAIVKITGNMLGIETRTTPSIIDNNPDITPKNGVYIVCVEKVKAIKTMPWTMM